MLKQNYIKPVLCVEDIVVETMLATSGRIDIDDTPGTPVANERRDSWETAGSKHIPYTHHTGRNKK